MRFKVEAICLSRKKGTQKIPVEEALLVANHGLEGDAHAGDWPRQVSFLAAEDIEEMKKKGLELQPGAFGENIVTRGIDWCQVVCGGRIIIGEAELEITQLGKECHTPCAIYHQVGYCIMPEKGVFARVKKGGRIRVGDYGYYHF